jgi:hypothetical protein
MSRIHQEAAWLAGFLDGEGFIGISRRAGSDWGPYQPKVQIVSTNREVLERIRDWVGGGYLQAVPRRYGDPRKDLFVFTAAYRKGLDLIRRVRPYMHLKTQQADIFLQWYDDAASPPGQRLPEDKRHIQDRLYYRMRELNKKGKSYVPSKRTMVSRSPQPP